MTPDRGKAGATKRIQRLARGIWTAFCWRCHYGVFRRDRAGILDWAWGHEQKHPKRRIAMRVLTELGVEKRCPKCGEFWPADREFFGVRGGARGNQLRPWCRACESEYKRSWKMRSKRLCV